jgi:hypothetical protein
MVVYAAAALPSIMLHLLSIAVAAFRPAIAHRPVPVGRNVRRALEFAFPLAKRDYDCFNKAQRVPANGARLGSILSRS